MSELDAMFYFVMAFLAFLAFAATCIPEKRDPYNGWKYDSKTYKRPDQK
jgi:hypothetical protein